VPRFGSFHEAFKEITGHNLLDAFSKPITDAKEAVVAATWPNILGTSMHRRLIKDYLARYPATKYLQAALKKVIRDHQTLAHAAGYEPPGRPERRRACSGAQGQARRSIS
jgi:hypothetical protein